MNLMPISVIILLEIAVCNSSRVSITNSITVVLDWVIRLIRKDNMSVGEMCSSRYYFVRILN